MALNKKYNGWSNYETWRVSLEFFDGYLSDINQNGATESGAREEIQAESLKDFVEECLAGEASARSTVYSYALAFLEDVDWREIEAHLVQEVYQYDWSE